MYVYISPNNTSFYILQPAHLGMTWQYQVEWYPGGDASLPNVILVESKPRNLGTSFGLVSVEMWTNSDSASDFVTNQHPLAVFVRVMRGRSPVFDARVTVDVVVEVGNGTEITLPPMRLWDKGNGGE